MVLFNYSTKELTAKIVYYGPGLCGKTTNLQYIHGNLPGNVKGKMLSLATKTDRTLFFDFLPIDLGEIRGMKTRVQLYTVPGQVFYNETRKLVLKGADGIVFVADSQEQMLSANAESFKNLEENLKEHGLTLAEMPHVIQFNKRDLPKLASIEQLNSGINKYNAPFYESVATTGIGVQDTLKAITKLVLLHLTKKYDPRAGATMDTPSRPTAPAPVVSPQAAAPAMPNVAETQSIPVASIPVATPDTPSIAVATAESAAEPIAAASADAVAPLEVAPVAEVEAVNVEAAPTFDDNEIDELVGEVEDIDDLVASAEPEVPVMDSPFEIDATNMGAESSVEPASEWTPDGADDAETASVELPEASIESATPSTEVPVFDANGEDDEDEVLLTNVADGQALFEDANLDVAGVAPGEEREIIVPVELGNDGAKQRFKLSVRLRLDPVD